MMRTPLQVLGRQAVLAAWVLLCAGVCWHFGAAGFRWRTEIDVAASAWNPITISVAIVAYSFASLFLWPVDLSRAIPFITGICVLASVVLGYALGPLALMPMLLVGICAMVYCRARALSASASSEDWRDLA
ncbi:MAG: hypothetical protein JNJ88_08570 [Planctomycetes bacterium]|nr:hypothetical protein [Planctomycetota bacterium]